MVAVRVIDPLDMSTVGGIQPTITWEVTDLDVGESQTLWLLTITDVAGGSATYFTDYPRPLDQTSDQVGETRPGQLVNGRTYTAKVAIWTNLGRTVESPLPGPTFLVDAPVAGDPGGGPGGGPCGGAVGNVRVRNIGGCDYGSVFPRIRVSWDEMFPCAGQDFVRYEIHRRLGGATDWDRIADVEDSAITYADDVSCISGTVYEYSVVWVGDEAGDSIISDETSPPLVGVIDFDHLWIHTVGDPMTNVRLNALESQQEVIQDQEYLRAWGRRAPTAFIGSELYSRMTVPGLGGLLHDTREWSKLFAMMEAQRDTGAVYMARFGRARFRMFCQISGLSRDHQQASQQPRVELTEVQRDDIVGIECVLPEDV